MRTIPTICTTLTLCLIFIIFNLGVCLMPPDAILLTERRMVAPFPSLIKVQNLFDKAYYAKLDSYIADRLLGKDFVFTQISAVFSHWFYQFDTTNAVRGQDNWLFLGNRFEKVLDKHTKDLPLDTVKTNALLAELDALQQAAASVKATFFTVVCPDKHVIYQEFLPKYLQNGTQYRYAEKVIAKLRETGIDVIDLTQPLMQKKESGQIYYKTDTHWNMYGAQVGFNHIYQWIQNTQPHKDLPSSKNYRLESTAPTSGDLVSIGGFYGLQVSDDVTADFIPVQESVQWHYSDKTIPGSPTHRIEAYRFNYKAHMHNDQAPQTLRVLLFCDSFMTALAPFFNINYSDALYMYRGIPLQSKLDAIREFKPQIILYQTVERSL